MFDGYVLRACLEPHTLPVRLRCQCCPVGSGTEGQGGESLVDVLRTPSTSPLTTHPII